MPRYQYSTYYEDYDKTTYYVAKIIHFKVPGYLLNNRGEETAEVSSTTMVLGSIAFKDLVVSWHLKTSAVWYSTPSY